MQASHPPFAGTNERKAFMVGKWCPGTVSHLLIPQLCLVYFNSRGSQQECKCRVNLSNYDYKLIPVKFIFAPNAQHFILLKESYSILLKKSLAGFSLISGIRALQAGFL